MFQSFISSFGYPTSLMVLQCLYFKLPIYDIHLYTSPHVLLSYNIPYLHVEHPIAMSWVYFTKLQHPISLFLYPNVQSTVLFLPGV